MTFPSVNLYNPLDHNFTTTYDLEGTNDPIEYTLHAGEIESFPQPVAEHIKHHLAQEIAFKTRKNGTFEDAYKRAVRRIEVDEL